MTFFKITIGCLLAIGIYNFIDTAMTIYVQIGPVYSCGDKQLNPPDVQKHCERLTRGQWWSK